MGEGSGGAAPISNDITGTVGGHALQARDIHGGVHLHAAARTVAVPRQLPRPARRFVNRRRELAACEAVAGAAGDGTPIVVLHGPGGVGKTATALAWLWRNADRFPDGHLYADLGGGALGSAVSPAEVLARWLPALGVPPADVPSGLEELTDAYRSLVSGRRMAVLADNALSVAQVRPLLPMCERGVVVVTSRSRLTALVARDGARLVGVGPLEADAAAELLADVVGGDRAREPGPLAALAAHCAGFPLALCVAGAKLATRPAWPVRRLVDQLADERRRLTHLSIPEELSVGHVFDASYRGLPASTARLYRLLGLHPGPDFGAGVAAAALGDDPADAAELLVELHDAGLVEAAGDGDRYRFHDLLRLHARELADREDGPGAATAALRRMLAWYLARTVEADLAVMPLRWRLGPEYAAARARGPAQDRDAALAWLEDERANLRAAVRAAAEQGWDELTWQLCEALWGLYFVRKHYRDWVDTHELGVAAAQRCGDLRALGRMRAQLGFAYFDRERFDEAAEWFERAGEADHAAGHRRGEAVALESLGLVRLNQERYAEAVEYFIRTGDALEQGADARADALLHHHLGRALSGAGRHAEALARLAEARAMVAALPDDYNEARVLTSIGEALLRVGRPPEAAGPLAQALAVMTAQGARLQEARIAELLAEVAARTGDAEARRSWLERALAGYDELDHPRAKAVRADLAGLGG